MHLHTQFGAELPWADIDMNYMNLNQSAHGDREFGYIGTRLGMDRKVVVGHWQSDKVQPIDRRLDSRRDGLGRSPAPESGAFRRQHAPGRGDRRRQGRRADPASATRFMPTAWATSPPPATPSRRRTSTRRSTVPQDYDDRQDSCSRTTRTTRITEKRSAPGIGHGTLYGRSAAARPSPTASKT